jgi:RNA polymerase sigma-70 factor (ECF subfamily)
MNVKAQDIDRLICERGIDDTTVIDALFDVYYPTLLRLAQSILSDPAEAADAAQDALITAASKLEGYAVGTNFRGWICTIAVNTARSYLRKQNTRRRLESLLSRLTIGAARSNPEEKALQAETHSTLWEAVDQLGEKHRLVVRLHFAGGLTIQEVARALGIPKKTAYSRLYDALDKLRTTMGEEAA